MTAALVLATSRTSAQSRVDGLNIHALPLGDGKISDSPKIGYVMVVHDHISRRWRTEIGPLDPRGYVGLDQKTRRAGTRNVAASRIPNHHFGTSRTVSRIITGDSLPVGTPTGTFPVAYDDSAFQIDRNPNSILSQNITLKLPVDPELAATAACVPMGMIGVALNGVAIYNALDDGGRDAFAHEVLDLCSGHPQMTGQYHYHGPSPCLPEVNSDEKLVGYALDGFGIYSMYDTDGRELTNADLDECHGRISEVEWDGSRRKIYHYVLTREYPYTIGCFRGSPALDSERGQPRGRMHGLFPGLFGFPPPPPPGPRSGFLPPPPPP